MAALADSLTVDVPFEQVPSLTRRYLAGFPSNEREGIQFTLRAWIGGLVAEHDILLKVTPHAETAAQKMLDIRWESEDGGPYPVFHGTLSARPLTAGTSALELAGSYAPPGGVAGAAFDAVLGHAIALESARDILTRFKTGLEELHAGTSPAGTP
jgi:hypothetical protein